MRTSFVTLIILLSANFAVAANNSVPSSLPKLPDFGKYYNKNDGANAQVDSKAQQPVKAASEEPVKQDPKNFMDTGSYKLPSVGGANVSQPPVPSVTPDAAMMPPPQAVPPVSEPTPAPTAVPSANIPPQPTVPSVTPDAATMPPPQAVPPVSEPTPSPTAVVPSANIPPQPSAPSVNPDAAAMPLPPAVLPVSEPTPAPTAVAPSANTPPQPQVPSVSHDAAVEPSAEVPNKADVQLPVPSAAPDVNVQKQDEVKQQPNLKKKQKKHNKSKKKLLTTETSEAPKVLTEDQIAFINDESMMFLLEDDDVTLGELTKEARLDLMHGKEYIKVFERHLAEVNSSDEDRQTSKFIMRYEHDHRAIAKSAMSDREASASAFDAVSNSNMDDLRVMVDNYPILQSHDKYGNNMLMNAVALGNFSASKFLLVRGIDFLEFNSDGDSALSIADESPMASIRNLMERAVFKGRVR